MTSKQRVACGAWPSPLGAATVAAASVRLGGPWLDGDDLLWTESRPQEEGRVTLLRRRGDAAPREVVTAPYSVRTRVHEYGGGAFAAAAGTVVFSNDADGRLYRWGPEAAAPVPLTPAGPDRFADLQFDPVGARLVCVVERRRHGADEPENLLAAVDLATGEVSPLARGADFYAFPRFDPAGRRLAYLAWNHPAMPWDSCELFVADVRPDGTLDSPRRIAGGAGEAIFQPSWSPGGDLCFVSDRSGFANLYRLGPDGTLRCLCDMAADFATPLWVFGLATHAWLDERTLACLFQRDGFWHLATLDAGSGRLDEIATPLTELGPLVASRGRAAFLGGSPGQPMAVHALAPDRRTVRLVHQSAEPPLPSAAIAEPRTFDFPTADGQTAHGLFYPPHSQGCQPLPGERPPLLVLCHGGPSAAAGTALNLGIQFWSSRGFAVLDVNYRGSTGYGRAYRKALNGAWGVVDVADCVAGARALATAGRVDARRMAIRGSSAGGFTVLCALAFHDVFAAGASYYGVCDLEALAKDTHKFERHYLDGLVGPYPERRDLYQARSPLHAATSMSCPVIFFHGEDDRVVPKAQAEAMANALRQRGLAAPLVIFPGEQHGFRQRETIRAALEAELDFYRGVFRIAG